MFFFKKKADPLAREMRRLEKERCQLERQVSEIEHALQNPPDPEPPPVENQRSAGRGAKFSHDRTEEALTVSGRRASLKIQRARSRRRIIIYGCAAGLILIFFALILHRCSQLR